MRGEVPAFVLGRAALAVALALTGGAAAVPSEALVRKMVGEVALAQLQRVDPGWQPAQRDCAGFVRFVYRSALRRSGARSGRGLWRDKQGRPADFADAQTLLATSFNLLGRGEAAWAALRTGDLLAFRQERGGDGEEAFHLMLVVRPEDAAHAGALLVYHPGEPGAALRAVPWADLLGSAPREWRPRADNPAFLGFYRFQEWSR